jgi:hypothetical protein
MTTLALAFLALQLAVILAAGWQATAGCLILDLLALLVATAEGTRRLGVAGLLRYLAVRLDCAAWAWERGWDAFGQRRDAWAERARE